jgi:hypothetical protein
MSLIVADFNEITPSNLLRNKIFLKEKFSVVLVYYCVKCRNAGDAIINLNKKLMRRVRARVNWADVATQRKFFDNLLRQLSLKFVLVLVEYSL